MYPNDHPLILRFGMESRDGTHLSVPCNSFWHGFTLSDHLDLYERVLRLFPAFIPKDKWSTGYRYVFISVSEFAILTYCEGDLDLTIDADATAFWTRMYSARDFYADH